jgi:hypothetical protein
MHPALPPRMPLPVGSHEVYGTIKTLGDGKITLATRTGKLVPVAVRGAIDAYQSVELRVGETIRVIGSYDSARVLQAVNIIKAKPSPKGWPDDR